MELVYYCNQCNRIVDSLEVEDIDEEKLGLSILTSDEKEDIIKRTETGMEIGVICDECEIEDDLVSLINNNLLH